MWFRSIVGSNNTSARRKPFRSMRRNQGPRRGAERLSLESLESRSLLTFMAPVDYTVGSNPQAVAAADFTNNGIDDLVTCSSSDSTVSILMGNGNGTFQPAHAFATGANPTSVTVGDLTGNGMLDIVTGNRGYSTNGPSVSVLMGNGDGTFQAPITFALTNLRNDGVSVAIGDMNHDGRLDLVVAGDANASPTHGVVDVFLGHGDGTFSLASATNLSGSWPEPVKLADLNGDGNLDVVAPLGLGNVGVALLMGNGNGTLGSPTYVATGANPASVAVGDVNGDGKLDLVTATDFSFGSVSVLLGNGDGTFTDAQSELLDYGAPRAITVGNFNGDTFPDLALIDPFYGNDIVDNIASVLLNGANWSPPAPTPSSFSLSGFPTSTQAGTPGTFAVTALNADGTVDTGYTGTVQFSSSDGQAALPGAYTFTAADAGTHTFNATLKTSGTQSITATDTSTGTVTGSETGTAVSPAAASHFAVSAPASSTAGNAVSVTVTALDPYNNVATGYAGTVHFTSSDGQASLASNYTFTAGDTGVHTFTSAVTLKTAGNQTVTTTDTTTNSITGGTTVAVNAAAASTMVVSGFPSPITAGVSGSFMVTLKDAYGNVATGYTGTVHFASSDAKAVLPGNYTFTSADAGKHTFSATLKTAGTQSITATDTVNASLHSTDSGITLKPAAASKFVLGAPASVQPGVPFSLTITVEDAYGNIVTGYTGTIHFTSSDSLAHLPANYTFTAGNNGAHTFTGLVLKKAGNQTITVTDTKNNSITGKTVVDVL
jgi:hypothetical protein